MIPAYFAIVLFLGLYKSLNQNKSDFFNLSRSLTLPSFVATLVTTWYGGILEIGRFTFVHGIVTWVIFGFFYYLAAIIYGFLIGPKLYRNNINNIPEYFEKNYGFLSSKICSLILILISSPAPYILIFSTILSHIYGFKMETASLIGIIMSMSYVSLGGFKSIINTDKFQFILMYLGFSLVLFFLVKNYGGISFIINNVSNNHLKLTGDFSIGYIFSWSFIAMITFIDPNIFQRVYSSKNEKIIKKGFLISILFWFIFDFLKISIGLYSFAIFKSELNISNPYLEIADKILPNFYKEIFYIAILSVVMSTIDSFTFVSAETIKKNFLKNINYKKGIWIGTFVTAISSFVIVNNFNNVIDIWYLSGTIGASVILIPFINSLFFHYKTRYPEILMLIPLISSSIWIYLKNPFSIDALYIGILTSISTLYFTSFKSSNNL